MTTSRALLLPAQEVTGVAEVRVWLARFDSVLTSRLENGGVGTGWAYPRDAMRYSRQNPTYATDPRAIGAYALKTEKARSGFSLPEPFATRARVLSAIANARAVIVPVAAAFDSTKTPRAGQMQVTIVDPKSSRVVWTGVVTAAFAGGAIEFADSLAAGAARLFVRQ